MTENNFSQKGAFHVIVDIENYQFLLKVKDELSLKSNNEVITYLRQNTKIKKKKVSV